MGKTTPSGVSRRAFTAASVFTIVPRHVLGGAGYVAPSDKVTLASIGMGRQGMAVTMGLLQQTGLQVVAVCDCNQAGRDYAEYGSNAMLRQARETLGAGYEKWGEELTSPGEVKLTNIFKTSLGFGGREPAKRVVEAYYAGHKPSGVWKGCTAYGDYRELLEKEKDVDAVYVATPDHWHAPIGIAAMKKRKHVLGQKPMTHSIGEARRMAQTAREMKVATSVTVTNPSSEATKLISAWIADGAIGPVREVHNWSSRPYWPQGVARPAEEQPIPAGLDWDMWLGPAAKRPFNRAYLPFVWRGWFDFGCGSFGDMGCYSFAGIFKILNLTPPTVVEASASEPFEETFPGRHAAGEAELVRRRDYAGAAGRALRPGRQTLLRARRGGHHLHGRQGDHPRRLQRRQPARAAGQPELPKPAPHARRWRRAPGHRGGAIDRGLQRRSRAGGQFRSPGARDGGVSARLHRATDARREAGVGRRRHEDHQQRGGQPARRSGVPGGVGVVVRRPARRPVPLS
jgi:predicted dehydrogenase